MNIYPGFYKEFSCVGNNCLAACAGEWYPHICMEQGEAQFLALSLSCEEVLRILHHKEDPITISVEGVVESSEYADAFMELLDWGMRLLQNDEVPIDIALGTVGYLGMEALDCLRREDYAMMREKMALTSNTMSEFIVTKMSLAEGDLSELALQLVYNVTEAFTQLVRDSDLPFHANYTCGEDYYQLSEQGRKQQIAEALLKQDKSKKHRRMIRRLATAYYMGHLLMLHQQTSEEIFVGGFCNYMILVEVLPLMWSHGTVSIEKIYLSTLAQFGRLFDAEGAMNQLIWPILKQLYEPDVLAYSMAFMKLFGD